MSIINSCLYFDYECSDLHWFKSDEVIFHLLASLVIIHDPPVDNRIFSNSIYLSPPRCVSLIQATSSPGRNLKQIFNAMLVLYDPMKLC